MKKITIFLLLVVSMFVSSNLNVSATTTSSVEVRSSSSEYIITDDGRFGNPMDVLYFNLYTGDSVATWQSLGYTTVKVYITIEMKEVNAGYQYIFLYQKDNSSSTDNKLFDSETIEYGGGGLAKTSWGDYLYESNEISLSELIDDKLIIRYGASGFGSDTWKNRDLRVVFEFN